MQTNISGLNQYMSGLHLQRRAAGRSLSEPAGKPPRGCTAEVCFTPDCESPASRRWNKPSGPCGLMSSTDTTLQCRQMKLCQEQVKWLQLDAAGHSVPLTAPVARVTLDRAGRLALTEAYSAPLLDGADGRLSCIISTAAI